MPAGDLNINRLRRDLESLDDDPLDSEDRPKHRQNKKRRENGGGPPGLPPLSGNFRLVPLKQDILRFYVVHRDFDNLLQSKYLSALYNYTNEMMKVTMEYEGKTINLEHFCKKEGNEAVSHFPL